MEENMVISYRPELPDYGAYLKWPTPGEDWIHPEDRQQASELAPNRRIFRRHKWDGEYYWLQYGETSFRVKPTMWLPVPPIDVLVGEQVEVLQSKGDHDPGIFRVVEVLFNPQSRQVEYFLRRGEMKLATPFARSALRPIKITHKLRQTNFDFPAPKARTPVGVSLLNVGELTSSE